jgi:hypothetical protein
MSQIQGPLPQLSPYQGSLQQQAYAVMASPGMGTGDTVALTAAGTAAAALLGLGIFCAATHSSTSSAKKPESPQTPTTPDKKAQTPEPQPKPAPVEPSQSSQAEPASTEPTLSPTRPGSRHSPGKVDSFGIYREWQKGLLCGKHSLNTILHTYGLDPTTETEFVREFKGETSTVAGLAKLLIRKGVRANLAGLDFHGNDIGVVAALSDAGIEHCRGMILPCPYNNSIDHLIAIVPGNDGRWHVSNSFHQDSGEAYDADNAYDALWTFQNAHNYRVPEVLIAH